MKGSDLRMKSKIANQEYVVNQLWNELKRLQKILLKELKVLNKLRNADKE